MKLKHFLTDIFATRKIQKPKSFYLTAVLVALGISISSSFLITFLSRMFPDLKPTSLVELSKTISDVNSITLALMFVTVGIISPVLEELFFRGLLWRLVEKLRTSAWSRIILISLLFSWAHSELIWIIGVLPLAIWLGYLRYKSRSTFPCILAHIAVNCSSVLWLALK